MAVMWINQSCTHLTALMNERRVRGPANVKECVRFEGADHTTLPSSLFPKCHTDMIMIIINVFKLVETHTALNWFSCVWRVWRATVRSDGKQMRSTLQSGPVLRELRVYSSPLNQLRASPGPCLRAGVPWHSFMVTTASPVFPLKPRDAPGLHAHPSVAAPPRSCPWSWGCSTMLCSSAALVPLLLQSLQADF